MEDDDFKVDFVGIATNKAATTWIYQCLKEHPDLCMSKSKEAHIFSVKEERKAKLKENFSHCSEDSLKGEYTPSYLIDEAVIEKMKAYNPDIKLIACLRDPVQRAWSQYLHDKNLKDKDWNNLRDAIKKDRKRIIERGLYHKHLKKWLSEFSEEQILILFFHEIKNHPQQFIQKIFSFLEVEDSFVPDQLERKTSPTAFKDTRAGRFFHKRIAQPLAKFKAGKKIKRNTFLRGVYSSFVEFYLKITKKEKPNLAKKDAEFLYNFYRQDIEELEKLLNENLNNWKL